MPDEGYYRLDFLIRQGVHLESAVCYRVVAEEDAGYELACASEPVLETDGGSLQCYLLMPLLDQPSQRRVRRGLQ